MSEQSPVTFLFTDIEGSTARWEQQPEAMRVALARHDALARDALRGVLRRLSATRPVISGEACIAFGKSSG